MLHGVRFTELDFRYMPGSASNSVCQASACRVFHPDGGGVQPLPLPLAATDPSSTADKTAMGEGTTTILLMGIKNVGTDLPDLVMARRSIRPEICETINVMEGLYPKGDPPLSDSFTNNAFVTFDGTGATPNELYALGDADTRIAGRTSFCVLRSSGFGYYYYRVLVAR